MKELRILVLGQPEETDFIRKCLVEVTQLFKSIPNCGLLIENVTVGTKLNMKLALRTAEFDLVIAGASIIPYLPCNSQGLTVLAFGIENPIRSNNIVQITEQGTAQQISEYLQKAA